jgi:ribonuclease HI
MHAQYRKELSGGFRRTTNNRMELLAVIMALKHIKSPGLSIQVYTDSKYVCDAIEKKWLFGWKAKGWKKVKNVDLWQAFLPLYEQHKPKFYWVKGHAGIKENERCDVLATTAAQLGPTEVDVNYEKYESEQEKGLGLDI